MQKKTQLTRRDLLKYSGAAGAATLVSKKAYGACVDTIPVDIDTASNTGCPVDADFFPTSPLILNPFVDPLPIPQAMRPGWRRPDGTLSGGSPQDWTVRQANGIFGNFISPPGPGPGQQDSIGDRPMANDGKTYTFVNTKTGATITRTLNFGGARSGTHQLWPGGKGVGYARLPVNETLWDGSVNHPKAVFDAMNSTPLLYHIRLQVAEHGITTSPVQPIDASGQVVPLPP